VDRTGPEGALSDAVGGVAPRRLFAPVLPAQGVELELSAEAAQHARVLRLAVGDLVQLFDGRGSATLVEVLQCGKGALRCVGREAAVFTPRAARVVLVQCLPKAGKLDDIVRMTTELGVAEIALAVSEYCVARAGQGEHKLERLERIAVEAGRQSEQSYLPELSAPRPLAEVLARAPQAAYRAACVERSAEPLPFCVDASELWLVIGPEGGFSPTDRALLSRERFVSTALGRSILRTETAAVVGVALALERLGRRNG
jgi:16S rRNA (uracil1498-N3)-methyltransferase